MSVEHVDVLIVGAGLSGIGAACRLTREHPQRTYLILERRQAIGGTWDLFRYPGVRSDSDMFTFGFNFRPWSDTRVLADGPSIRGYLEDTAAEYGVRKHIRFGLKVQRASWSSTSGRWTLDTLDEQNGERKQYTCTFLVGATGYYNYDTGHRPEFPGQERFGGPVVHPQFWPEDLDYTGKRVVVIGSGATAVTLVPAMAGSAAHVTMLQRSPSYVVSLPALDKISAGLRKVLPDDVVYKLARWRNIAMQRGMYRFAKRWPRAARRIFLAGARKHLGGPELVRHFDPSYDPWDQRLCVVPDGDLFTAIRTGRASVVTDRIDTFTETGIRLHSGAELAADIIVSATGLDVQMFGGAELVVDGEPVRLTNLVTYKAVLIENVPNAAMVFGYTNASWTLKADIASEYVCRLLTHMDEHGYTQVVARAGDGVRGKSSVLSSLNAGYVRRGDDQMPRQGTSGPWLVHNDYFRDAPMLRRRRIADDALEFRTEPVPQDAHQLGAAQA